MRNKCLSFPTERGGRENHQMRLAKFLSSAGVASRRAAERLITDGRVVVNGRAVTDPALDVRDLDVVEFDGRRIEPVAKDRLIYIILHKPAGVVCTMSVGKEKGACLADLVQLDARLYPIGRLDRDSSGLLLLTNDGKLTYGLTHPKHSVEKEYIVRLDRPISPRKFARIKKGVVIDDRLAEVDDLKPIKGGRLSITIHEGRKRIIRRLFEQVGCKVTELKRVRIGSVKLGKLPIGKWRYLRDGEIASLDRAKQG